MSSAGITLSPSCSMNKPVSGTKGVPSSKDRFALAAMKVPSAERDPAIRAIIGTVPTPKVTPVTFAIAKETRLSSGLRRVVPLDTPNGDRKSIYTLGRI